MMRSQSPLRRNKPINKKRSTPRRGQATQQDIENARKAVYERSGGECELRLGPRCISGVLPFSGITPWDHGHFVHITSKGAGGKYTAENGLWGCHVCHLEYHHTKGIPLPKTSTNH